MPRSFIILSNCTSFQQMSVLIVLQKSCICARQGTLLRLGAIFVKQFPCGSKFDEFIRCNLKICSDIYCVMSVKCYTDIKFTYSSIHNLQQFTTLAPKLRNFDITTNYLNRIYDLVIFSVYMIVIS